MKELLCFCGAVSFLAAGAFGALRRRRGTAALAEAVRFVRYVRAELRFAAPPRDELLEKAHAERYRFVRLIGDAPRLDAAAGAEGCRVFDDFCARIGTTDRDGQTDLCDEAESRLSALLSAVRATEEGQLRVNLALSVLGALGVCLLAL